MLSLWTEVGIIAQASFKWTPATYYIAAGIIHTIVILVGFRMMGVDPEHNSFIGAALAGAIINVAAYFLREQGVVGAIIIGVLVFGLLAAISSGEILKAFFMGFICIAMWGAIGSVLIPRTPLEATSIGGYTQIVMTGGMEAEPIREEDTEKLSSPLKNK